MGNDNTVGNNRNWFFPVWLLLYSPLSRRMFALFVHPSMVQIILPVRHGNHTDNENKK
jgi:hypothetical protein